MERFYHIRARQGGSAFGEVLSHGGATILINNVEGDPFHVEMRIAWCHGRIADTVTRDEALAQLEEQHKQMLISPRDYMLAKRDLQPIRGDVFCKERGRAQAQAARVVKLIHLRDIPGEFKRVWIAVQKRMGQPHWRHREYQPSFEHLIRDWLPRDTPQAEQGAPDGGDGSAFAGYDLHGHHIGEHPLTGGYAADNDRVVMLTGSMN